MRRLLDWIPNLWSNPLSLVGTVLTTVTGFALLVLLVFDVTGLTLNPYVGVMFLVGLPALFVLGLLLIPVGILVHRRRHGPAPKLRLGEALAAAFSTPSGRRKVYLTLGLTLVNVGLLAGASQRLVAWTSSPTFCGTACHGVMEPEWVTYHGSRHARVACVECHVGSGASALVRSKMDGLRQVWKTVRSDFDWPIETPVRSMRPSKDTCEHCHWPDRWDGQRPILRRHTYPDEANTERVNVLVLNLGGRDPRTGAYHGIHWHAAGDVVRYEAYDRERTKVGKVTVLRDGQVVREFLPPGKAEAVAEVRTMDCIDCHNRPTHVFDLSPSRALDRAFAAGLLDRSTKWLREVAEPVLSGAKHARATVEADFRTELEAAYRAKHKDAVPDAAALDRAAKGLAEVWRGNVFPDRAVAWGTYPNHIGHQDDTPALHGCFRCHDDKHKTADGRRLSGECEVCHETVAQDDKFEELDESVRALLGTR
jgi:hypothetical protein